MGDRGGGLKAEGKPTPGARGPGAAATPSRDANDREAPGGKASSAGVPPRPPPLGDGAPLARGLRATMERRLRVDLGDVRTHVDAQAQQEARARGARAFTWAEHVFLGPGERLGDELLMAHELAHVAQQRGGPPSVQRRSAAPEAPSPEEAEADAVARAAGPQAAGLLVEDGEAAGPGQLTRGAFLAQLREATTTTAAEILGPVWARGGCPYLEAWFARHGGDEPATLERMAQRYAGDASTAAEYIPAICARLREGILRWSTGGELGPQLEAAGLGPEAGARAVMPKEAPGARFLGPSSAAHVAGQLGPGEALEVGAAARLGGALGESFAGVRVHVDARAARLASELGATAFTIGSHVAFAAGEYQPGTPPGDALLAHELAHVAQQRAASGDGRALARGPLEQAALEEDADQAAVGAMATLYRAGSLAAAKLDARRRLRGGLALQRCKKPTPEPPPRRPAPKEDHQDLARGTMTWKLQPFGNSSAQMQISFKPKPGFGSKTITFLQTVLYTRSGGPTPEGETLPGPRFQYGQRRVDLLAGEYDPFYGASWNGTRWVAEGLDPELARQGFKSAPSTAADGSAYLFDQPSVNPGGDQQLFESVAVVPETGETLGALRWGVEYGTSGVDRWKLLGAEKKDCVDAPSAEFTESVARFYTQYYDALLDRFPANDATPPAAQLARLDGIPATLQRDSKLTAWVGGFADATERDPGGISRQRAQAVKDDLVRRGAPDRQVVIQAYGAAWARYRPSAAEERNRRVQVLVTEAAPAEPAQGGSGSPEGGTTDAGRAARPDK